MTPKPKLFIGSSVEGLPVAHAIQSNLTHNADVIVWDQGVFALSDLTIESLISVLSTCDFGIFVFSPDDVGMIKGTKNKLIRDNVLFELGLFIGNLGRTRTFMVAPANTPKLRIPTDLIGITLGKYDNEKLDDNPQASTAVFCNEVRIAIRKQGLLRSVESSEPAIPKEKEIHDTETPDEEISGSQWLELYSNRKYEDTIISINEKLKSKLTDEDKAFFNALSVVCKIKMNPLEGLKEIEVYLEINKKSVHTWQVVTFFYLHDILFQKAEKTVDEGLKLFPNNPQLLIYKAELFHRMGKRIEAIELLRPFIGVDENLLNSYLDYCKQEGMQDEALNNLRLAFLDNTYSEFISSSYARIAYDQQKYKVALYLYYYLMGEYPANGYYKVMFGNCAMEFDLYDIAYKNYKEADRIYMESETIAIENIGNVLRTVGLYSEAKTNFLKASALNKESSYSYTHLSTIIQLQKTDSEKLEKIRIQGRIEAFFKPDESSAQVLN